MKCAVCNKDAFCRNYGVLSCNACKMFFKRYLSSDTRYTCKLGGNCLEMNRKCRACRLEKCRKEGMTGALALNAPSSKEDWIDKLMSGLLHRDRDRENVFFKCFTKDDPSLKMVVENFGKLKLEYKDPAFKLRYIDWVFMKCLTGVKFLMDFDFMQQLHNNDKMILLNHFYLKSTIMFFAFQAMQADQGALLTPDGESVYGDALLGIPGFTRTRLECMRSQPIGRFIELRITKEEFLLVLVILFANPVLDNLSDEAIRLVSAQRQLHNSALFHFCRRTHPTLGHIRFMELLSLSHIMNKSLSELEFVTVMFRAFQPDFHVQKLVCNEE